MIEKVTLQQQAYDYLKKAILNGSLDFETNYSETSFAELLGISRTPVREAIFKLRQEGFLESIPGCGFQVKKLSLQDIRDFYEMRGAVEAYCVHLMAEKQKKQGLGNLLPRLKQMLTIQKVVIEQKMKGIGCSIDDYVESDDQFHELIVQASGNHQFIEIIGNMRGRIKVLAKRSLLFEGRLTEAYEEHVRVAEFIEQGEAILAYREIIKHFSTACSINIKVLEN